MQGENHPRWNPTKSAMKQYANKVRWLSEQTYNEHKLTLNPNNYPEHYVVLTVGIN
jgi:beta-N-acetylglucosaminidase